MLHFILFLLILGLTQVVDTSTNHYPIRPVEQKTQVLPSIAQTIHRWMATSASFRFCDDPVLALKIMKVESNFNNIRAKNESSTGLMQVKPETAQWIGCKAQSEQDLLDVELNVRCGCRYLGRLSHRYSSIKEVIVAYNAGAPIICRTGTLKSGKPCEIGKYINADYYYKVAKAEL